MGLGPQLLLEANKAALAASTGIGLSRLSRLANGHELPSVREARLLSGIFDTDVGTTLPGWLAGWASSPPELGGALGWLAQATPSAEALSVDLTTRSLSIAAPVGAIAAVAVPPEVGEALVRRGLAKPPPADAFDLLLGAAAPAVLVRLHRPGTRIERDFAEVELFAVDAEVGVGDRPTELFLLIGAFSGAPESTWVLRMALVPPEIARPSWLHAYRAHLRARPSRHNATLLTWDARIAVSASAAPVSAAVALGHAWAIDTWLLCLKFLAESLSVP